MKARQFLTTLPCCGSTTLLQDILREEGGFEGHVVFDCGAIADFDTGHKVTRDRVESAALALKSGSNLNCGGAYRSLPEAVKRGLVTEEEIDASLATIMATRFRLGLFDPETDVPYTSISLDVVASEKPLYPFGFGLRYATFSYEAADADEVVVGKDTPGEVQVKVTNTGSRAGDEALQLYVSGPGAGTKRPLASLAGLERVSRAPGESQTVTLPVTADMLKRIDEDGGRVLDSGEYTLAIGGASPGPRSEALGAPKPVTIRARVQ